MEPHLYGQGVSFKADFLQHHSSRCLYSDLSVAHSPSSIIPSNTNDTIYFSTISPSLLGIFTYNLYEFLHRV